jgi:hypothetical protein
MKIRKNITRLVQAPGFNIGQHVSHSTYFAFVALQGHGMYTYVAGVLFIMACLEMMQDHGHGD